METEAELAVDAADLSWPEDADAESKGPITTIIAYPDARTELAKVCGRETLELMRKECFSLKVSGVNDVEGFELIRKFRFRARDLRLLVEDRRKKIKEVPLKFCQELDSCAGELKTEIQEWEAHCLNEEKIVTDWIKRREEEDARIACEKRTARIESLQEVRATVDFDTVGALTDEQFETLLATATDVYLAEEQKKQDDAKRLAELEAKAKADAEKLAEQEREATRLREELLGKQREELAEKQRALDAAEAQRVESERKLKAEQDAREKEAQQAEEARLQAARDAQAALEAEKREAERKVTEERKAREKEAREAEEARLKVERDAKAAEDARIAWEARVKRDAEEAERVRVLEVRRAELAAEMEAAEKIADDQLFEEIKAAFPSVESAWVEIARLRKLQQPRIAA